MENSTLTVEQLINRLKEFPMEEPVYLGQDGYEIDRILDLKYITSGEYHLLTLIPNKSSVGMYSTHEFNGRTLTEEDAKLKLYEMGILKPKKDDLNDRV